MTTTGDSVVIERIPALPTTHYEFELLLPVVCVRRDGCWTVKFGEPEDEDIEVDGILQRDLSVFGFPAADPLVMTPPMIYAFGEPDEPLGAVTKVFFEAVCATWCGALRAESELPTLNWPHDDPSPDDRLPPYPDAKPLTIDDELPREDQFDADEATEIWTGDEMRGAIALLRIVQRATLSGYASRAHHKRCCYCYYGHHQRWMERKDIKAIAKELESRYKKSIFW